MTVDEMRSRIEKACTTYDLDGCKIECPLKDCENCYDGETYEEIKENYELMFGKEETEMKSEFDFNELKAGYGIKIPAYRDELFVGIPVSDDEDDIIFYSKELKGIISKKQIVTKKIYEGHSLDEKYIPVEVYGLSSNSGNLFNSFHRPLLWKKEDMNQKIYKINNMIIEPNYKDGYKYEEAHVGSIYINRKEDDYFYSVPIKKSELDDVINALIEIRDFIKENE